MTPEQRDGVEAAVRDAVHVMQQGAIVTRYLLVAEVIDEDGDKAVFTLDDENAAPWDTWALARMAMSKADAAIARQDAE